MQISANQKATLERTKNCKMLTTVSANPDGTMSDESSPAFRFFPDFGLSGMVTVATKYWNKLKYIRRCLRMRN